MEPLVLVGTVVGIAAGSVVILGSTARVISGINLGRGIRVVIARSEETGQSIGQGLVAIGIRNRGHYPFLFRQAFIRYNRGVWIAEDLIMGSPGEENRLVEVPPGETKYGVRQPRVIAEWQRKHGRAYDVLCIDAQGKVCSFDIPVRSRKLFHVS